LNILTKICVVVLLVLVLVASVVFINMATVPTSYRAAYDAAVQRAEMCSQDTLTQKLIVTRQNQEMNDLRKSVTDLQTKLTEVRKDLVPDAAQKAVQEYTLKLEQVTTLLTKVQADLEAAGKRNELLAQQLQDAQTRGTDQAKQIAELQSKQAEVRGELQRSEREVRAMELQLRDRDEKIKDLETQLATRGPGAAGAAADTTVAAAPQGTVTGTVSAVRGEHASINVGSAQGVARGQKYYIYRNASFVGYLRIDEVDEGEAAGTVVDKQLDPVIGDKVTNNLAK
jgi:hypothetical protein